MDKRFIIFQYLLIFIPLMCFGDANVGSGFSENLSYDEMHIYYQPYSLITEVKNDIDYLRIKGNYYFKAVYTKESLYSNHNLIKELLAIRNRNESNHIYFEPKLLIDFIKDNKEICSILVGRDQKVIIDGKFYTLNISDFKNLSKLIPIIYHEDFNWLSDIIEGKKAPNDVPLI